MVTGVLQQRCRIKVFVINHKTVSKLMAEFDLKCLVRKKRYCSYKAETGRIAPNVLEGNLKADKPNQKWATDVTEFALFGMKLYLSPIIDLFNEEIISYNIAHHPTIKQPIDLIYNAFKKMPDNTALILHSDQGWQSQHQNYRARLKNKGVIQSMSSKGNCLDNAVIENLFGHLKAELLYLQRSDSIEHFKMEVEEYIPYYNNDRIKMFLNKLSPVKYRTQYISY